MSSKQNGGFIPLAAIIPALIAAGKAAALGAAGAAGAAAIKKMTGTGCKRKTTTKRKTTGGGTRRKTNKKKSGKGVYQPWEK